MQTELEKPAELPRIKRLKAMTDVTHERLDARIMGAEPFASRERYALFLAVQHHFHADVDPLYNDAALNRLLPDLASRCRLDALCQDIVDVTGNTPGILAPTTGPLSVPAALGWLYVAEGSNLGAAFLLKAAAGLGLSEEFGARHLAGHESGRGVHWRTFVAAFNDLDISHDDELDMVEGAKAAFRRVHALVDEIFV
jgi:heme oxygenase